MYRSLPNLSPSADNLSLPVSLRNQELSSQSGSHDNQECNLDNHTNIHVNQTDNTTADISIKVPDVNLKTRKRKYKRKVSLLNRIDEFYKKLDDFDG